MMPQYESLAVGSTYEKTAQLTLLDEHESKALLMKWSSSPAGQLQPHCIHELFETQVSLDPNAIALVFGEHQMSYAELNAHANQFAHWLRNHGVTTESLVGLCIDRSFDMVIAVLAIFKAGGAYVPLDPAYPQARIQHMLADADITTVLCHSQWQNRLTSTGIRAFALDDTILRTEMSLCSQENIGVQTIGLTPNHLSLCHLYVWFNRTSERCDGRASWCRHFGNSVTTGIWYKKWQPHTSVCLFEF